MFYSKWNSVHGNKKRKESDIFGNKVTQLLLIFIFENSTYFAFHTCTSHEMHIAHARIHKWNHRKTITIQTSVTALAASMQWIRVNSSEPSILKNNRLAMIYYGNHVIFLRWRFLFINYGLFMPLKREANCVDQHARGFKQANNKFNNSKKFGRGFWRAKRLPS